MLTTAAEARAFTMHGVTFHSFVSSERGAESLATWRADFAAATPGRAHAMSHEEVICLIDGSLQITVDGETVTALAGDVVRVPAGAWVTVSNTSDRAARAWVTTSVGMTATLCDDGRTVVPPWAQ